MEKKVVGMGGERRARKGKREREREGTWLNNALNTAENQTNL